jgi:MerR family copper efflux transcriptional regulator
MAAMVRLNVDMKSSADPVMGIGEIAGRFGLATHVLRHWEAVGLLSPARAGGHRRYGRDDLYRVAMILCAKEAGFGLDDIREMVVARDPVEREAALRRHRAELARRIAEARASLSLIDCALGCDHEDFTTCAHFQALVAERIGTGAPARRGAPHLMGGHP